MGGATSKRSGEGEKEGPKYKGRDGRERRGGGLLIRGMEGGRGEIRRKGKEREFSEIKVRRINTAQRENLNTDVIEYSQPEQVFSACRFCQTAAVILCLL